jgi:hypothetical protein
MNKRRSTMDLHEVTRRAAEVRRHWTQSERTRRLGLPPDSPLRLRHVFTPGLGWLPVVPRRLVKHSAKPPCGWPNEWPAVG